ncbi:hypothetical protein FRUB_05824 [Fimbriiglobus ruber]|uniref:Uncharacterized protein n=1 Tax=Fimbriiglobus ruber TaxID=1908690 RepID=A0A225DJQ2_9BACT|nr:hypothetical protein FRUB_05824 [Fimbriiglobus ruber]
MLTRRPPWAAGPVRASEKTVVTTGGYFEHPSAKAEMKRGGFLRPVRRDYCGEDVGWLR